MKQAIGVFDSGYGGLTVFRSIAAVLPQYDYIYLGDNARAPYGNRSFDTVHDYTLEAVRWFFAQGCPLVILACNTASAKALRVIQQSDLPGIAPDRRVLGVIRPTAEVIGHYTRSKSVGILGTKGTVLSNSYPVEIARFFPEVRVSQQACPMLVALIENGEQESPAADYLIEKYCRELLARDADIDTVLLACTHYPIIRKQIAQHLPPHVQVISQGEIVAQSLDNYLFRHPEVRERLSLSGRKLFYTTDDDTAFFDAQGSVFYGSPISSVFVDITG